MLLDDAYASFVNLDHRTDRLNLMLPELQCAGVNATRTRGLHPDEVAIAPEKVAVMRNRTPGAIGCHFSQVSIMKEALAQGKHAFVMEDDLIFCEDFQKRMGIISEFLQNREWDVFWLGGTFHINPPHWHKKNLHGSRDADVRRLQEIITPIGRDAELTDHPNIVRTYGAFSTHAYVVNRKSLSMVLDLLDQRVRLSIGIDFAFISLQLILRTFAFVPGCIIQRDNQSDIGKGITRFSSFSRLGAHWFAPRMEDFNSSTYNWAEAKI